MSDRPRCLRWRAELQGLGVIHRDVGQKSHQIKGDRLDMTVAVDLNNFFASDLLTRGTESVQNITVFGHVNVV